jgi:hypothetical protein
MSNNQNKTRYYVDLNDIDIDRIAIDQECDINLLEQSKFIRIRVNYRYTSDIILPLLVRILNSRVDHFRFKHLVRYHQKNQNKPNKLPIPIVHKLNTLDRFTNLKLYIQTEINKIAKTKSIIDPKYDFVDESSDSESNLSNLNLMIRLDSKDNMTIDEFKIKGRFVRLGGSVENNANQNLSTVHDMYDMLSDMRYIWRSKTPDQDRDDPTKPHYLVDSYLSITGWFTKQSDTDPYYRSVSVRSDCEIAEFRYNKSNCVSTIIVKTPVVVKSRVLVL